MKIALFYYDGFVQFEIALLCLLFKDQEIISIALENREYRSFEQQRFCVDKMLNDVDPGSIDLLVIPGGDSSPLHENSELNEFVLKIIDNKKKVSGICGGSELLAALGILKGLKCTGNSSGMKSSDSGYKYYTESILSDECVVVDGNVITAQGQAYAEFAVESANQMGLIKNQPEYDGTLNWLKNKR